MKITIVGAGNMGRGIGTRAVGAGAEVEIANRDPSEAKKLAEDLGSSATAVEPGAPLAKRTVTEFASDAGLRPIDVGPLRRARQLEQLGFLHMSLPQPYELGFGSSEGLRPPFSTRGR